MISMIFYLRTQDGELNFTLSRCINFSYRILFEIGLKWNTIIGFRREYVKACFVLRLWKWEFIKKWK